MKVVSVGLKAFQRDNGTWAYTTEILLNYEGEEPSLSRGQMENIEKSLGEQRLVIKDTLTKWQEEDAKSRLPSGSQVNTQPLAGQGAGPTPPGTSIPPICTKCGAKCVMGEKYWRCPACKENRKKTGEPF